MSAVNQSTVENTLPDNQPEQQMNGDDDRLVDEILDELNEGAPVNSEKTNMNLETDPSDMNHQEVENSDQFIQTSELPPMMNVEYNSSENNEVSIKNMLKKPLIVLCISFIVFNPLVLNILRKYIPSIITNNIFYDQIQTLLFSVLVAVLFLGTNYII